MGREVRRRGVERDDQASEYLDIYIYNLYSIIRQLVDKEVVMAAAAFAISHERMQAVNFTSAIDLQPYAFMYRRPKEVP